MKENEFNSHTTIHEFSCFFVRKFSSSGLLVLYKDHLIFQYANGDYVTETNTSYDAIKDVIVDSKLGKTVKNLEIHTGNNVMIFSGLQNTNSVRDYILLLMDKEKRNQEFIGFTLNNKESIKYEKLKNPSILCSLNIPTTFDNVMNYVKSKEAITKLYEFIGNEDVIVSDWVKNQGYEERTITYKKLVVVPVLGKNLILIKEFHRLFHLNGIDIDCSTSDLGTTPYSDCFAPYVQQMYIDNGDSVNFVVQYEIEWVKSAFVKGIVETKTISEFNSQYNEWHKQIVKDLLGTDIEESVEKIETPNQNNKFAKYRRYYKITIIILLCLIFLAIIRTNWHSSNVHIGFNFVFTVLVTLFFIYVMLYF